MASCGMRLTVATMGQTILDSLVARQPNILCDRGRHGEKNSLAGEIRGALICVTLNWDQQAATNIMFEGLFSCIANLLMYLYLFSKCNATY